MGIDVVHPQVMKRMPQWNLIRDFVEGEMTIKSKGETYLPRKSGQDDETYYKYKARAKCPDYTEQALNTMHGMIFKRAPVVMIPDSEELAKCLENFDREGHTFYQASSNSCYDNLQTCFGGLLVDMPNDTRVVTEYDAQAFGIRPYCKYYSAEDVMDWRCESIDGVMKLSFVKLKELVEVSSGINFTHEYKTQYRILSLDDNDFYNVSVWYDAIDKENGHSDLVCKMEPIYPKMNGTMMRFIPFEFLPYKDASKPLLYGVAELNKHYYMQSADYENGVHLTTLPSAVITGFSSDEAIRMGEDIAIMIPEPDAKAYTVQFAGEGLDHSERAIAATQEQIGILGTRSISPDKAMSETSDAAKIHRQGENAKLATYARDISEVYTRVLNIMARWLGVKGRCSVQFNIDYSSNGFDPNMLNAIANLSREGKFPVPLIYESLRRTELIPNTMTLEDFMFLLDIEASGATAQEELELYQKILAGESVSIPSVPVIDIREKIMSEGKTPEFTKEVSLQEGK